MPRMPDGPGSPALTGLGTRGAVVAPHHLATAAGLEVLDQGGSAVDAAIATNAALAVVAPDTCGLGGDAFWLIWDEGRTALHALAGVGAAARRSDPDRLRAAGLTQLPVRGPLPITVPGTVRSWRDAHTQFGHASVPTILDPAIRLAAEGFPASKLYSSSIEKTAAVITGQPWATGFRQVYRPHNRPWAEGETVYQPALAATLQRLAEIGLDEFYEGGTAALLASSLEEAGSAIRADDLASQASRWSLPLVRSYRGIDVATHPLPSCGIVGLLMLSILDGSDPPKTGAFGTYGWRDAGWTHIGIEAAKLALAVREANLGDPDFGAASEDQVLDPDVISALIDRIDPGRASSDMPSITTLVGGTAFIAATDESGNAVSLIASNASDFGSGVVDARSGIAFHDRGQGFSLDPAHPNALEAGKRPLHSLLPAMLLRGGRPWVLVGSMGGDVQPQILTQVVSAIVDGLTEIGTAISVPRWSVEPRRDVSRPVTVLLEPGFDPTVSGKLQEMGHTVRDATDGKGIGHCHAIELQIDGGDDDAVQFRAATDPRSEGRPAVR